MKKAIIVATAFMAVMLAGCGHLDEPTTSAKNDKDNKVAAQIEVQTKVVTETTTTKETVSAERITPTDIKNENTIASIETTTTKANESTPENIDITKDYADLQVSAYETTKETASAEKITPIDIKNENTIASIETTIANPSTTEKITIAEDYTDSQVSAYEMENKDTPQEVSIQETKITQNDDTPTYTNLPTTSSEITKEPPVQANMEISEIFQKLNNLHYEPMICDGIPDKRFIAEDGTVFAVNFSERLVWRNEKEEAKLTDELYDALIDSEPICLY